MRKIKLVAMDVDGTLIGKNKILTRRTKDTLTAAAAQNIHLVVASGRALQAVPEELIQIPGMEYVITSNGSSVFRLSDRKRIYGRDMTPEQIENKEKQLLATVQGVNLNILRILPAGSDTSFNLDMSAIPAYFKGGIAPGSHVNVTYIGDLETTSLEEVRIIAVTGEDPDTINDKHISFTVTGTIIGSTANTITVQTDDGAIDTFRTENAQDLTAGGMEYGDYVCVTFHPSKSKSSNIYTAIKVQDA